MFRSVIFHRKIIAAVFFCLGVFTVAGAGATQKFITDFARETSPYFLDDGDSLTILTRDDPPAPFEIRIRGGAVKISVMPESTWRPSYRNLFVTSLAATTLTAHKLAIIEAPAEKSALSLAGHSTLVLSEWNSFYSSFSNRSSAAGIHVPAGRSLTITDAGQYNYLGTSSIGGNDVSEAGGNIYVNGRNSATTFSEVRGRGTGLTINSGSAMVGTFTDTQNSSFTVNGGTVQLGYDGKYPPATKNGQTLGYITIRILNGAKKLGNFAFSIAGHPEYTIPGVYPGDVYYATGFFLPPGRYTLHARSEMGETATEISVSADDIPDKGREQIVDLAADRQYPSLSRIDYSARERVTLPAPHPNAKNTVGVYVSNPGYQLLSALEYSTRLEGGIFEFLSFLSSPLDLNPASQPPLFDNLILDKGALEIEARYRYRAPMLMLRDGSAITAEEYGTRIRARLDPQCSSTKVELLSGRLSPATRLPSAADIGDGCPASAITPPATRYALQDGLLSCSPQKLRLSGTFGMNYNIDGTGFKATFTQDMSAGQHAYVVALIPGEYLGTSYDQWFQNTGENGWVLLDGLLQPFYTASASGSVDLEVMKNLGVYKNMFLYGNRFDGIQIYLGIGGSAEEMIANRRYCGLMQMVSQRQ